MVIYILIGIFLINIIYTTFFEKKFYLKSMNEKKFSNIYKDNNYIALNISNTQNDNISKYDKKKFDPEIIHFYNKDYKNSQKRMNERDDEDDIVYPDNYKNIKIIDEDEIEFKGLIPNPEKRINITIEYDSKYQDLYDEITKQLDGNITYLNFYPKLVVVEGVKKILKYILHFSLCICCLCFVFIDRIIDCCYRSIPKGLKNFLSVIKFILSGGSYLFHIHFIKKITHSNIFEVYVEHQLKYSTIKREQPPIYIILFNIINNMKNN